MRLYEKSQNMEGAYDLFQKLGKREWSDQFIISVGKAYFKLACESNSFQMKLYKQFSGFKISKSSEALDQMIEIIYRYLEKQKNQQDLLEFLYQHSEPYAHLSGSLLAYQQLYVVYNLSGAQQRQIIQLTYNYLVQNE